MANEIYRDSWWGSPTATGWGNMYYNYIVSFYARNYSDRVIADGGIVESLNCVDSDIDLSSNPIITLIGNAFEQSLEGQTYTDAGATAFDALFFGDLTNKIKVVNNVNINKSGTYNVEFNVTDPSGIAAKQVSREVYIQSLLVNAFETRILADSGVVESLSCIEKTDFGKFNWLYNFRVIADGGIVESLGCVNRIY
tara:strand:+ start:698 stop:1285 length:588 start_codon:yes stop_codon:yes gene_type:complete